VSRWDQSDNGSRVISPTLSGDLEIVLPARFNAQSTHVQRLPLILIRSDQEGRNRAEGLAPNTRIGFRRLDVTARSGSEHEAPQSKVECAGDSERKFQML
jgi:hypothetical protein